MPEATVHCPACHDQFSVAASAQTATCPRCKQEYEVLNQKSPVVLLQIPRRAAAPTGSWGFADLLMWVIGLGVVLYVLMGALLGG